MRPNALCVCAHLANKAHSELFKQSADMNASNLMYFQVEGDTVTFSFEMRSGREHNTPDKAMWGFSCTVRAQVPTHGFTLAFKYMLIIQFTVKHLNTFKMISFV